MVSCIFHFSLFTIHLHCCQRTDYTGYCRKHCVNYHAPFVIDCFHNKFLPPPNLPKERRGV